MTIVIMKFGGSCLRNIKAFKRILKISKIYESTKKIYVASAFNGITDLLFNMAHNISDPTKLDTNMAILEKKHFDIVEQIFKEDSEYYVSAKKWIDDRLSDLEDVFADVKEFGLEPYYQDYILSFGEILSTYILNQYLLSNGFESVYILIQFMKWAMIKILTSYYGKMLTVF